MNKNIFKITHTYAEDRDKVIIETKMDEMELVKLIKIWQIKAWYILDTFDFFPKEIFKVLQYCDCEKHTMQKGEKKTTIDLYEVWEAHDIEVKDDDLVMNKHLSENATKEFLKILLKEIE